MSALPNNFRRIRLELAREPKHPAGNPRNGYEFAVPLAANGSIDAETWRKHRDHCRVRRFRDDGEQRLGRVARKPGGNGSSTTSPVTKPMTRSASVSVKRPLCRANMYPCGMTTTKSMSIVWSPSSPFDGLTYGYLPRAGICRARCERRIR